MTSASADEVIRAIDAVARHKPGGAIAFDGDGTLWSGDVGDDVFSALIEHGLHRSAHQALVEEAAAENLATGGSASEVAHRIHAAYLAGAFPEERICEIMTWAAAGRARDELDRFCAGVIEAVRLTTRLQSEVVQVVEHARRVGLEAYIVSASPRAIVEQAARLVGIAPDRVIAARETCDAAGVVTCGVDRPIPYGPGKVSRLREKLGARVLYAAFGDNAFDVPLLCAAEVRVAVRPKARLLERAAAVPELLVLERA